MNYLLRNALMRKQAAANAAYKNALVTAAARDYEMKKNAAAVAYYNLLKVAEETTAEGESERAAADRKKALYALVRRTEADTEADVPQLDTKA